MTDLARLIEKLMSNCIKLPDGCWVWTGATTASRPGNSLRYGSFAWNGRTVRAHRASYEAHNGKVLTKDQQVCHRCDNPPCINPEHLFVGDAAANNADCRTKKRDFWSRNRSAAMASLARARKCLTADKCARGEEAGPAKMTPDEIKRIRLLAKTTSQRKVARLFGLTQSTVSAIVTRRTWVHVD